jgi:hypothetical protein
MRCRRYKSRVLIASPVVIHGHMVIGRVRRQATSDSEFARRFCTVNVVGMCLYLGPALAALGCPHHPGRTV